MPKETIWTINSTFAAQNPNRSYNVYFYDSVADTTRAFDHAIISPVGKTGAAPSIDLKVGDFLPLKHMGANGLIGPRAGQTVGHYIKLDHAQRRRHAVQALRHLARTRDRHVRRGLRRPAGGRSR